MARAMGVIAVLAMVLALAAPAAGQTCDGNPIDERVFSDLLGHLARIQNTILRREALTAWLRNSTNTNGHGFSGNQTIGLMRAFTNTIDKVEVVQETQNRTLGLTCKQVTVVMKETVNTFQQMDLLRALVNSSTDLSLHNETLIKFFQASFNQEEAAEIVAAATATDCVWGDVSLVKRLYMLIDVSGSMNTMVNTKRWGRISRVEYAVKSMKQVVSSLSPSQEFNLVSFATYAHAWRPGVQPVSAASISSAHAWADKLRADGTTNAMAAFQLAFKDPRATGIFFLSDGLPNTAPSAIISAASAWSKTVKGGGPVYPIGFFPSGNVYWMAELAQATGGTYKNVQE